MTRQRLLTLLHNDLPTPLHPTMAHYLVEEQMKRPPILWISSLSQWIKLHCFRLQLDWTDIIGNPPEHRYCLPIL